MAALTITASQVLPDDNGAQAYGNAGASITAGQVVYLDSASNTWKLFDANDVTANTAQAGIALCGSSSGQPIKVQLSGSPTLGAGAAPAVGTVYVAGATPGAINPTSDLATGWRTTILGVGASGNKLAMATFNSGATVP